MKNVTLQNYKEIVFLGLKFGIVKHLQGINYKL